MQRSDAAACALYAALVGCPAEPVAKNVTPPEPAYSLEKPLAALSAPTPRDADFRRGVSLGLFVSSEEDRVRKPLYVKFLDEIVDLGATDIQLVVRWSQTDVHATQIAPHAVETVEDALLTWVMDEAQRRKLRVFLLPILHVEDRAMGAWRGTLAPPDWDAWWWSYRRFVLHYARLASDHHAEMFSVGSELLSTEQQSERWLPLIAEVRKVFRGKLTYSANWDHFEPVTFWDALDVVGVTGYQELSKQDAPSDAQLARGFAPFAQRLRSWAMATGKRYVFTEVGYPSQPHAASRPWDYGEKGPVDLLLQLRCYRALYEAWQADPRLSGLYVWNWFGEGGATDPGYTPRGKPSASLLSHWYKSSRASKVVP